MTPYYDEDGVTIYHGDAREILSQIEADTLITDPIWPNCEHIFAGVDAKALLAETLEVATVERVVVQIGCASDARFLGAVPDRWPYIRTCWLEYACPSYQGRILNTGDVAYVFGRPPKSGPGRHVLPGRLLARSIDKGLTRWNWDNATRRKLGRDRQAEMPHPTPRRLAHVEWLCNWFSERTVVDPFMGSGTTMVAARQVGRKAIGIEIEERYIDLAIRRLSQGVLALEEDLPKRAPRKPKPPLAAGAILTPERIAALREEGRTWTAERAEQALRRIGRAGSA